MVAHLGFLKYISPRFRYFLWMYCNASSAASRIRPSFQPATEDSMPATSSLPLSAHELQEAMRSARPIDAARLARVLRVQPGHGVVEVQANTTWRTLAERLRPGNPQAASLRRTVPTVAACLPNTAAGPDGRQT